MAIFVDEDTRLVVQGLTGSEGRFHGLRNRAYGTKVVAGVTPGKGGQDVEGVPVFDTVVDAVAGHDANTAMVFVPAPFAADAIYEAIDAGVHTVITITEGVPAHEMLRIHGYARAREVRVLGPNCPGALSPGKANVGIIPAEIFRPGSIGLVSRSGTLTYQIGHELTQRGLGNSTIVVRASARSFLHSQVRSMVGSLKLVGEGKWAPREFRAALDARDRSRCGPLAPPEGLYLVRVDY